ncbi:3856_t:CDS:2, partial [Cetraspora pellucida]
VYKIEPKVLKDRGKCNIVSYKFDNLKNTISELKNSNNKKKRVRNSESEYNLETQSTKQQCRQTNDNEKKILKPILNCSDFLKDKAFKILKQLLDHGEEGWMSQWIRRYWSNNRIKKNVDATCIKGHRSSSCNHQDRPLIEIKRKGRPITQCDHCRELRKTQKIHVTLQSEVNWSFLRLSIQESSSTTLNNTSLFSNKGKCTTGAKCVCYHPADDNSSLVESHCSTAYEDSVTSSLSSIPSYDQPVIPQEPKNCNQSIIPIEPEHRDPTVFTSSLQSCPSAMASGSCCGTSTTESVCRCGTGCGCEGCGTHSLTITSSQPVKNCCSTSTRIVSQYEYEINDDDLRDVTS